MPSSIGRTDFSDVAIELPRFDGELGYFTRGEVTASLQVRWDDRAEIDADPDANPYTFTTQRTAEATIMVPGMTSPLTIGAEGGYTVTDLFSDGVIEAPIGTDENGNDVPGDDGFRQQGSSTVNVSTVTVTDAGQLIGVEPLVATLSATGAAPNSGFSNGDISYRTFATGQVCITYFFEPFVSIGDRVWLDVDRDGLQGAGEPPLGDVRVVLERDGEVVAETVTDAAGFYSFTGLQGSAGYRLRVVAPAGYGFTVRDAGADAADSDVDAAGVVDVVAPADGVDAAGTPDDPSFDAGLVAFDLTLTKALVSEGPFQSGDTVTYRLVPSNLGPAAALPGWSVVEVPAAGMEVVSMSGDGYQCEGLVCVASAGLPAGKSGAAVTVKAKIGSLTGPVRNVAYVAPAAGDVPELVELVVPTNSTNTGATVTNNDAHVDLQPSLYDLALVKTVADPEVSGEELAVFTIKVVNQGDVDAGRFTVTDWLPAGLKATFASNGGVIAADGRTVTWTFNGLPPGEVVEVAMSAEVTATAAGELVNVAEVSSDSGAGFGGDADSVADFDAGDDVMVDQTVLPSEQLSDRTVDEDDHDVAVVRFTPPVVSETPTTTVEPTPIIPATGRSSAGLSVVASLLVLAGFGLVAGVASSGSVRDLRPAGRLASDTGRPG